MTDPTPGTFVVERATTIAAPADRVFAKIQDFHCWTEWSPWEGIDPEMTRTHSGSDAGRGAVYEWSGNRKAGSGRMEITGATAASEVVIALEFLKPFKARNVTRFTLVPDGDSTRVTWTMTGRQTFGTRLMGIFTSMDKMIGPDFEKGLAQLKKLVEG